MLGQHSTSCCMSWLMLLEVTKEREWRLCLWSETIAKNLCSLTSSVNCFPSIRKQPVLKASAWITRLTWKSVWLFVDSHFPSVTRSSCRNVRTCRMFCLMLRLKKKKTRKEKKLLTNSFLKCTWVQVGSSLKKTQSPENCLHVLALASQLVALSYERQPLFVASFSACGSLAVCRNAFISHWFPPHPFFLKSEVMMMLPVWLIILVVLWAMLHSVY